jgi:hypothetical protein
MSTKSREVIWGSAIMGAKMRAKGAREVAQKAAREADRAGANGRYGGPAQPSPTIGQCIIGGYGWLEVKSTVARPAPACPSMRSGVRAIRPIWKLEAAIKCRSCGTRRHKPTVHMVKLTERCEIGAYRERGYDVELLSWVDDDGRAV